MKKLFIIFTLIAFIGITSQAQTKPIEKAKTELAATGKDLEKAIDSTCKDTAAVAAITEKIEDSMENLPEKGSPWYVWFMWIFGIVYFVAGIVASHWPTKKNLWYLRLIPIIVKLIASKFVVPENKKKEGGNHSV